MRLLAFQSSGKPALGLRLGDEVVNLSAEGLPATLDELLRAGHQQQQGRPQALAACGDDVLGDLADQRHPGVEAVGG